MSKIIFIPTYENLHLIHNEIKYNAMAVHYNHRGGQQGYLGLVVSPTIYALLTKDPFVHQVHTRNLVIPISATRHAQE